MYKEAATIDFLLNRLAHEKLTDVLQTVAFITNETHRGWLLTHYCCMFLDLTSKYELLYGENVLLDAGLL